MMSILGILFVIFCIWLAFKIIPIFFNLSITMFVIFFEIIAALFLLPLLGLAFLVVPALIIGGVVLIIKAIV